MPEPREVAERLAQARVEARSAKDFSRADELRSQIAALGFDLRDTPAGYELSARAAFERVDPSAISVPAVTLDASLHLLYEGYREDLERFLSATPLFDGSFEIVVTDNGAGDSDWIASLGSGDVRTLHFDKPVGWAQARNAAARSSRGHVLVFADLSVEPQGDIITPLLEASESPVGLCGPWGLTSSNMREFEESPGPAVDAIEGYLLAVRREVFFETGFDEWFRWYRHADLDLSFRIRSRGLVAKVVPLPATRHDHRGWLGVPEPERTKRSKRNFYRFLDSWKDRPDLLVSHRKGDDEA